MDETQILDVARDGILTMVVVTAPILLTGLVVGLTISLFQTLTQIQEMTLVFVPKIMAVFISLLFFLPFMIGKMTELMNRVVDLIISLP